jgi:hypothetical protein
MPDEPAPPRAVSSTPRAIGPARALGCLVHAFWRGEFCSRSPDRISVAAGPLWAGPTASTSPASTSRAMSRRRRVAGGRRRRERRSAAAQHAANGGMRRRSRLARIVLRLFYELGRPFARLCDACQAFADEMRACAPLYNVLYIGIPTVAIACLQLVCGRVVRMTMRWMVPDQLRCACDRTVVVSVSVSSSQSRF